MAGILQILERHGFPCHSPKDVAPVTLVEAADEGRPSYAPFEDPKPKTEQILVEEHDPLVPCLFRYFIDGSMRTTNAGHIVDGEGRYLPIFITQIAVAATRLENGRAQIEEYRNRNVFLLPNTFSQEDRTEAGRLVRDAAGSSHWPLSLDFECYIFDDETIPLDSARKKMLSSMHEMEIEMIKDLTDSKKVTREDMLIIDGSLQFYRNLDQAREAFRNVVGVAKTFDLHQRVGSGKNAKQHVGALVAGLRRWHRTPARKVTVPRANLSIGAWYMRLHSPIAFAGLGVDNGVVKLELFPDGEAGHQQPLATDRCDLISRNILALRHPTTPSTDTRWASHLYPIHLTERYIGERFRNERAIRAYL